MGDDDDADADADGDTDGAVLGVASSVCRISILTSLHTDATTVRQSSIIDVEAGIETEEPQT